MPTASLSIGGLWGVALFLSLPLRFQPQRLPRTGQPDAQACSALLTLENVEASTPDGEMALIKRYTFRVGASEASLNVQSLGQGGSA
jgi:hypothetical protein